MIISQNMRMRHASASLGTDRSAKQSQCNNLISIECCSFSCELPFEFCCEGLEEMVRKNISVLVSYEKPFMSSSVERLLTDCGFNVIANVTDKSSIDDLVLGQRPDMCVIGCHSQGIYELCGWLQDRFADSQLVLLDTRTMSTRFLA